MWPLAFYIKRLLRKEGCSDNILTSMEFIKSVAYSIFLAAVVHFIVTIFDA